MKNTVKIGCLATLMSALLAACTPMRQAPGTAPSQLLRHDTIVQVSERTVTDTIEFAPEYFTLYDTVPCPAGLTRDSLLYVEKTVYKPGQIFPYEVIVRDTIRTIQTHPVSLSEILTSKYSWAERLLWVLFLIVTAIVTYKKTKKA